MSSFGLIEENMELPHIHLAVRFNLLINLGCSLSTINTLKVSSKITVKVMAILFKQLTNEVARLKNAFVTKGL